MSERAWWRTGAGVIAWLVLAVAASGVAWAAVAVVGDESEPAGVDVPAGGGQGPGASTAPSTGPSSNPTSEPTPGDDGSEGTDGSRTVTSAAGSVTVTCTGPETIRMDAALPADGWQMEDDAEKGPDEVEVEFVQGDSETRIRVKCDDGQLESDVDGDDD